MAVRTPRSVFRPLSLAIRGALLSLALGAVLPPLQAAEAPAADELRSYAIAPGPLGRSLAAFASEAGVSLSFDPALTDGLRSPGLQGRYSAAGGLLRLLDGSGLQLLPRADGSYTLVRAANTDGALEVPASLVTGLAAGPEALPVEYAGGQVARGSRLGMLGNTDVMSAPFSVVSYTAQTIEDQQARSVADLLVANDTSVRVVGGRGDIVDTFTVRGFPVNSADTALNGLYGVLPFWRVPIEFAERVELLKGPNALLSGMSPGGSVGGAINIVPKRAADEPLSRVTLDWSEDSQVGAHVDVGRRFGEDNAFGVRFNGVYRDGDTALANQSREFPMMALALDFRGERLRLSADLLYQKESFEGVARPVLPGTATRMPDAPDSSTRFGMRDSYLDQEDYSLVTRGEYELSDDLTAFAAIGGRQSDYETIASNSFLVGNDGDLFNALARQRADRRSYSGEAGLRGAFDTGAVRHDWTFSGNRLYTREGLVYLFDGMQPGNLYENAPHMPVPDYSALDGSIPKTAESDLSGVALSDRLSLFEERLQFTLGIRHQQIKAKTYDWDTGVRTATYDEKVWTPMLGVLVKPLDELSLYANYIQGLSQGETAPPTAQNAGEMMAPYKARQYEIGAKYDFGSLLATIALFQIEKPSGFVDAGNVFRSDGEQRNRGLELSLAGELREGLRVLAGATYLVPELSKAANPDEEGNDAPGVSRKQANLGLEWDTPFLAGLTLNGRLIHTGQAYLDAANQIDVPSWNRLDLGGSYRFQAGGTPLVARANLENATGEDYWLASSGYATLSLPRTLTLSLTADF
ncbi:TonB-dependent siderophore receptor [Zestomonas carbonaria]|uniref:TonB-dependent siderophore receptor n=1 Tax=Zestomonas carbonaria TaxID=2762745 RepID=UPI001656F40B|nr:TonB-dependent receptor [Pseudomonas carbonaria]